MSRDRAEDESVQSWLQEISRDIMQLTEAVYPQDYSSRTVTYPEIGETTSLTDAVVYSAVHIAKSIDRLTAAIIESAKAKGTP